MSRTTTFGRAVAVAGLLASCAAASTTALADDKAACLTAASKGQRLRDTHKLVEARVQLQVCAAAVCPAVVQRDCAEWLADVERALPSVVLTAKSGAGADLVDVKVSVDGQPLVSKLDGQALSMNAGLHSFHFEAPGGVALDQQMMVREGAKNQAVAVVLGSPPAPQAAPPAPAMPPPTPAATEGPTRTGGSGWRTVGWVLEVAGGVGLGVGAVAGIVAMNDKNAAHCDASNVCNAGTTGGIKSAALASDIGWIAGGVLAAGGTALLLFAPADGTAAGRIEVSPVLTATVGGVIVVGSWR